MLSAYPYSVGTFIDNIGHATVNKRPFSDICCIF